MTYVSLKDSLNNSFLPSPLVFPSEERKKEIIESRELKEVERKKKAKIEQISCPIIYMALTSQPPNGRTIEPQPYSTQANQRTVWCQPCCPSLAETFGAHLQLRDLLFWKEREERTEKHTKHTHSNSLICPKYLLWDLMSTEERKRKMAEQKWRKCEVRENQLLEQRRKYSGQEERDQLILWSSCKARRKWTYLGVPFLALKVALIGERGVLQDKGTLCIHSLFEWLLLEGISLPSLLILRQAPRSSLSLSDLGRRGENPFSSCSWVVKLRGWGGKERGKAQTNLSKHFISSVQNEYKYYVLLLLWQRSLISGRKSFCQKEIPKWGFAPPPQNNLFRHPKSVFQKNPMQPANLTYLVLLLSIHTLELFGLLGGRMEGRGLCKMRRELIPQDSSKPGSPSFSSSFFCRLS